MGEHEAPSKSIDPKIRFYAYCTCSESSYPLAPCA